MVSLKRATTSCVVQKEKTQTRITFNNLSTTLTVNDLYKYVQLHLEEERPFQLSLVRDCGQAEGVALDARSSLKVGSVFIAIWLVCVTSWLTRWLELNWNGVPSSFSISVMDLISFRSCSRVRPIDSTSSVSLSQSAAVCAY